MERRVSLSVLPLLLVPFILLAPVYLRGQALFWGTPLLQFIPWWNYAWETLSAGHLPLWNPLVGMGAPLLANYQSALFYPPTWLYFLLAWLGGVKAMAWGQALLVAAHLGWAALGMGRLARRLGLGLLAQAVAGLAYGLSAYLVSRAWFLSINAATSWLPWVLLCLTALLQADQPRERRRASLLLTLCLCMQLLSGHAQTTWYTVLLAALWAGFHWVEMARSGQSRRMFGSFLHLALAMALALGLAAVQLLPTAEYLAQSSRASEVDFAYALNYSFWPWHLLTFLAPGLFGSPVTGDYWGYANYWEDAVYIGVLPLFLALSAFFAALRRRGSNQNLAPGLRPGLTRFLAAITGVSLLLALGSFTPLYPWLYRHIPTFDMFQAPARWMLWGVFALSLMAGIGAERWRRPGARALYWTRLGTAGAFSVMLGAGLGWRLLGDVSPTFVRATAFFGLWALGAGSLSLLAPPSLQGEPAAPTNQRLAFGWWRWAVVAWISFDLLVANWGLNPAGSLDLYAPSPTSASVQALARGGRLYLPDALEYELKYERFLRFDTFDPGEDWLALRAAQLPNTNMLDSLAAVNNFDPLLPGRFVEWLEMLEQAAPQAQSQLLRLMDVGVIETLQSGQPYGVGFQPVPAGGRVRWVPCAWLAVSQEDARQRILGGQVDFDLQVVLEPSVAQPQAGLDCAAQSGFVNPGALELSMTSDGPNRLMIDLHAPADGWLVLSDVWYPGWRAWVDGHPTSVWRANYLFRAVEVAAGDHQVVFAYRPASFWVGGGISLFAWLILAALAVRIWHSR